MILNIFNIITEIQILHNSVKQVKKAMVSWKRILKTSLKICQLLKCTYLGTFLGIFLSSFRAIAYLKGAN